eukprot:7998120-Pyramimonas_sp.AAC.1
MLNENFTQPPVKPPTLLGRATVTDLAAGGVQQPTQTANQTSGSLLARATVTDRCMPPPPPRAVE